MENFLEFIPARSGNIYRVDKKESNDEKAKKIVCKLGIISFVFLLIYM
ncbi:hypothetical protein BN1221_00522c [Brenneria goodwinii]|uniref:Uncharacterized protein n=1 Tax=Brenneria goodwinii TaxID=1109412 RepID=A0A0G4JQC5_9GAMM|nr:hypothetical protein BN1221_00522c [Brenneria goodwinii]